MAHPGLSEADPRRGASAERTYLFGQFHLLPERQLLLHAGEPVRIGSRAFDLLALLVQRSGEMVPRDELQAYVWPSTFVHESNLKVHVAALRKALASASGDARWILNVPGRGYCFAAPVTVEGRAGVSTRRAVAARASAVAPPTGLYGRQHDIATLIGTAPGQALISIVGPGGVGKTTLALAVAAKLAGAYAAPSCFVDLASIDDPQLVAPAVAAALGLRIDVDDLLAAISADLRATARLVILDNCEHVSAAVAAAVEHLAGDLGGSSLLCTSREPLRARQEHVFRLAPLACPPGAIPATAQDALAYPAVALFAARAAARTGYVFSDADTAQVSAICRRLDGLPLAIELAATRLDLYRPSDLLAALQDTLEPLSQGDVTIPPRHRALHATLDWSYRLLSDEEALILRFAAIFAREFTLEDIAAVLEFAGHGADVAGGMESLVAKSFAVAEMSAGARRYRLFESSRSHALAQLETRGEQTAARQAHARHLADLLERAEDECRWRETADWIAQYAPRLDDLRRALGWAFGAGGDALVGLRLTGAAIPLWGVLCHVDESRRRVKEALDLANAQPGCDPRLRLKLTCSRAWTLTYTDHQAADAEAQWREAIGLARRSGDTEHHLRALHGLATFETFAGRSPEAITHLLEFKAIAERAQEWSMLPDALRLLALARAYVGELKEGGEMLEHLAARFDRVEQRAQATRFAVDRYCIIRSSLAFTRWLRGRPQSALAAVDDAVAAALSIDHAVSHSNTLAFAGVPLALWSGELDRAEAGVAALRDNLAIRNTAVWRRFTRFFDAALREIRGDSCAVADMAESLDELLGSGFVTRAPMYLCMLTEALLRTGRTGEAQARLADAAERLRQSRERWCRPEIHRLYGRIDAAHGRMEGAEAHFAAAIADARGQGALIFELRAAIELARLSPDDGAADLAAVCARFGESDANRDLAEARTLLAALNHD